MSVITVSRQYGSGGDEIAGETAHALGYRLVNQDIMGEVANRLGVPALAVSERDEREKGLVADLVRTMRRLYPATITPVSPEDSTDIDDASYLQMIRQVIWEVAREDDAVIVGRGANFILEQHPGVLHILIAAPQETRVVRVMAAEGLNHDQALRKCHDIDEQRSKYIRHYYRTNWLDLSHYDLVLSTGHFSDADVVQLLCEATRSSQGA